MKKTDMGQALSDVVTETVEQFAFMLADPGAGPGANLPATEFRVAWMRIEAPGRLTVRMAAPLALCREFAANLLAVEGDAVTDESAEDAMRELLNVVCGRLASSVYGDREVVELAPPDVSAMGPDAWEAFCRGAETQAFDVQGRPLAVSVTEEVG
jgi:hypothetical protein